jgi:hypothetical protein
MSGQDELLVRSEYRIPRAYGKEYFNRATEAKYKERKKHAGLDQPGKWVVGEHITKRAHCIDFSGISKLHRTSGYLATP